jgi:hypothetical protein
MPQARGSLTCAGYSQVATLSRYTVVLLLCYCCAMLCCYAVLCYQAAYDAAPMLPPEGSVKGPCLLGSLSFLTDDFDWEGKA